MEVLELALGCSEPIGGPGALPLKLLLLPEQARVNLVTAPCLVERKRLEGGTLEGAGGALRRSGWLGSRSGVSCSIASGSARYRCVSALARERATYPHSRRFP